MEQSYPLRSFAHVSTMYRIKYLLGTLVAVFSLIYFLFGIVGWIQGSALFADMVTCFVLGSVHVAAGGWLLMSSSREYRRESRRVDAIMHQMIKTNAGRIVVTDLARYAEIPEDDAREYLERRSKHDVAFMLEGRNGNDTFFFGQQYWNN